MTSEEQPGSGIAALAFFLADFAVVESGKAYVSGGFWDRIAVPEFPSSAFFSVVAVIHVPWTAYHQLHTFSISVEDATGTELAPGFDGQFQVNSAPHLNVGDPTIMPMTGSIPGMTFDSPGDFSFVLRVDSTEIDRWPLRVLLADPSPADQLSSVGDESLAEPPPAEPTVELAVEPALKPPAEEPAEEPIKSAAEKLAEAPTDKPTEVPAEEHPAHRAAKPRPTPDPS